VVTGKPLQPETAVGSWQQWQGNLPGKPEIISRLDGGRSNRSYLLKSGNQKLVLRLNGSNSLLPGGHRDNEMKIWHAASAAGLAPPLLYTDEQQGILISRYIENSLPSQPEASKSIIEQAFTLLKRCHQLQVDAHSLDLAGHIQQYWHLIEAKGEPADITLLEQRKPMQALLESPHFKNAETGLCHHDPIMANFIGGLERLYLIDWEYAAKGLLVMDYAALAIEWGIEDTVVLANSGIDPELLTMAKSLYTYLCNLWEQTTA